MDRDLQNITWKEFEQIKDKTTVILPVGSTEQHGYHLPLSTDVIISKGLALDLAAKIDGIVASPITYGYKSQPTSGGGPLFPGTIDLTGTTMINLIYDVLSEFARDGVKKIFIVNGHFENQPFIIEAMDMVTQKYDIKIVLSSWWDNIPETLVNILFDEVPFTSWALEHAALTETSMIMYYKPELVHMERYVDEEPFTPGNYFLYPVHPGMTPSSGPLASARSSSFEKGKMLAEEIVNGFYNIFNSVLNQ